MILSLVLGVKKYLNESNITALNATSAPELLLSADYRFCALREKIYLQSIAAVGKVRLRKLFSRSLHLGNSTSAARIQCRKGSSR